MNTDGVDVGSGGDLLLEQGWSQLRLEFHMQAGGEPVEASSISFKGYFLIGSTA